MAWSEGESAGCWLACHRPFRRLLGGYISGPRSIAIAFVWGKPLAWRCGVEWLPQDYTSVVWTRRGGSYSGVCAMGPPGRPALLLLLPMRRPLRMRVCVSPTWCCAPALRPPWTWTMARSASIPFLPAHLTGHPTGLQRDPRSERPLLCCGHRYRRCRFRLPYGSLPPPRKTRLPVVFSLERKAYSSRPSNLHNGAITTAVQP